MGARKLRGVIMKIMSLSPKPKHPSTTLPNKNPAPNPQKPEERK
jgi:hypothetical protein